MNEAVREWHVPGRIELVGKHVDYLGGRSLTCATPWGLRARVTRRILAAPSVDCFGDRRDAYAEAVARRLTRDFGPLRAGATLEIASTLPMAAGMSSSSAYVMALLLALAWANELDAAATWQRAALHDRLRLAEYAAAIEAGSAWGPFDGDKGVGTRGGAQDHVAILCNTDGTVAQFAYRPATLERRVAWPSAWRLLVLHSGVVAEKTGAALASYNRVAAEGHAGLPDRHQQFEHETAVLVPMAANGIAAANARQLGDASSASQEMAARVLRNQIPETISLCALALDVGAFAASSFGAGFGGAVWAATYAAEADAVLARWRAAYAARYAARGVPWGGVMVPAEGMVPCVSG